MKWLLFLTLAPTAALADFTAFVEDLKQEATTKGLDSTIITDAFGGDYKKIERAVTTKKNQPEVKFSFQKYTQSLLSATRISGGQTEFQENQVLLSQLEQTYGVPAAIRRVMMSRSE